MSRNRIITQSEAIFVGPSPATGYHFTLTAAQNQNGAIAGLPSGVPVDYGYSGSAADGEIHLYGGSSTALTDSLSGFMGQGGSNPLSGVSITNELKQIYRAQGFSYDFNIARESVQQLGELAEIDKIINSSPTVSFNFSYLLSNFANEESLGFAIQKDSSSEVSALTNILNNNEEEKNYMVLIKAEGEDANYGGLNASTTDVVGIGNGFISSYTSEGSVGGFPTVNVSVDGLNLNYQTGISGLTIPAVNYSNAARVTDTQNDYNSLVKFSIPEVNSNVSGSLTGVAAISTLRPGDITLTFRKHGSQDSYDALGAKIEESTAKLQSYNLSINLSRTPIEKLGSRFAFTREIDFPAPISLSVEALVDSLRTGSLMDRIDCDEEYDVDILIQSNDCNSAPVDVCMYRLKKLTLDSQSYSSSIGSNKTVSIDFSTQVQGPNQTGVGIFMSGRGYDRNV